MKAVSPFTKVFIFLYISAVGVRGYFFLRSMLRGAPCISTAEPTARVMLELAGLRPGMTVYDLGSGRGRLLLLAAERGVRAIGIELDPFVVWSSRILARASPFSERIEVRRGDLWEAELGDADVVFVYLLAGKMERLRRRLEGRLKPGALVVTNRFPFPGLRPEREDAAARVYAYRFPAPASRPPA